MANVLFPNGHIGTVSDTIAAIMERKGEGQIIRPRPGTEEALLLAERAKEDSKAKGLPEPKAPELPPRPSSEVRASLASLEDKTRAAREEIASLEKKASSAFAKSEDPSKTIAALAARKSELALMVGGLVELDAELYAAAAAEWAYSRDQVNTDQAARYAKLKDSLALAVAERIEPILVEAGVPGSLSKRFTEDALASAWRLMTTASGEKIVALGGPPKGPKPRDAQGIPYKPQDPGPSYARRPGA